MARLEVAKRGFIRAICSARLADAAATSSGEASLPPSQLHPPRFLLRDRLSL